MVRSGGRRSGRSSAKKASTSRTRRPIDDEDVLMMDASQESDGGEVEEGDGEEGEGEGEDEGEEGDEGDEGEEGDGNNEGEEQQAENYEGPSAKEPSPEPEPTWRRKRLGRPPKPRTEEEMLARAEADTTPRRRGRGGWRGRGGRRGMIVPTKPSQVIDKEGTLADVQDDECVLPEDAEGETKVDRLGNLSGGREYRCRTFTVHGRGDRLYMLSTEPARCVGFRDSYLFFTKHLRLYKIIANDEEKRDMIEREIIPHSYKGRAIGIVTARSVFREFGARMIVGGKRITDDYNVAEARAEGAVEGELADPTDKFVVGEPYNKNQYVAWHGASSVYHQAAPAQPVGPVKVETKKRRINVNDQNWMLEHAREASVFNSRLSAIRKSNLSGLYDIHTNTIHLPRHMQPTRAVFEPVEATPPTRPNALPPLDPRLARNYLVMDTHLRSPSSGISSAAYDPVDPHDLLAPFRGLAAVSDEIRDLLPPECRAEFDKAQSEEGAWRERWDEDAAREKALRRELVIDRTVQPYSVGPRDV